MVGKVFADWTVLRFSHEERRHKVWWCQCKCGTEKAVEQYDLESGRSEGCHACRPNRAKAKAYKPAYYPSPEVIAKRAAEIRRTWQRMQLLARRGDIDPNANEWDFAILCVSRPHVHTELRLDDGRCFSAQAREGVRILPSIDTNHPWWTVIELPWKQTPELVAWMQGLVGAGYDYLGAIDSGFGTALKIAGRWFCSESSAEGMSRIGAVGVPELPCPEVLVQWTRAKIAGASDHDLMRLTARMNEFQRTLCNLRLGT